jgi:hypothetical protein
MSDHRGTLNMQRMSPVNPGFTLVALFGGRESDGCPTSRWSGVCKELAPSGHEIWMESGGAVPWAAASEPLNDEQQNQLKSNGPADINTNIDG